MTRRISVWTDRDTVATARADDLCPLLKGLTGQLPIGERRERFGVRCDIVFLAESAATADAVVLPTNYRRDDPLLRPLAETARSAGQPMLVFAAGDYEPILDAHDIVLFHAGVHRTFPRPYHVYAYPSFPPDPLTPYHDGRPDPLPRADRPIVGFCGQAASASTVSDIKQRASNAVRILGHRFRTHRFVPPASMAGHIPLRREALAVLAADARVQANFVIRDRYRAGVTDNSRRDPQHPTNVEFNRNICDSHYTLCVRGGGNFSVRLYETLSHGRVPLILDSDLRLPYDFRIDWSTYAVIVDNIADLADAVARHYEKVDIEEVQRQCRELWVDRLSKDGFFTHFADHLDDLRTRPTC